MSASRAAVYLLLAKLELPALRFTSFWECWCFQRCGLLAFGEVGASSAVVCSLVTKLVASSAASCFLLAMSVLPALRDS